MLGTVFALGIIYIIFLMFIASNPSGVWIDSEKNKYLIKCNLLFGSLMVSEWGADGKLIPMRTGSISSVLINALDPESNQNIDAVWINNQIIWIMPNGTTQIWNREIYIAPK